MTSSDQSKDEMLRTPVQFLKGVGPARAELLGRLGMQIAADVLFFFPRGYEDLTDQRESAELEEGVLQSVRGTIEDIADRTTRTGKYMLTVALRADDAGLVKALWFNQPFMRRRIAIGRQVMLSGKPKRDGGNWTMIQPKLTYLGDDEREEQLEAILPVYPLTEGLQQHHMRKTVRNILTSHTPLLEEVFPAAFLEAHDLMPIHEALPQLHFPADHEQLERARRRFVYQELFILQLALAIRRRQLMIDEQAPALPVTPEIDHRILRLFPFDLTESQRRVTREIADDMGRSYPMNRLLQGDVGSGKTIVAAYAMLLAVAHGHQAAIMAPTEVLARQHIRTLKNLLNQSEVAGRVRVGELLGGQTRSVRAKMLDDIRIGRINLVVGTHAIVQSDVEFKQLGLVVIDEQHKFGVIQRAKLKGAGLSPHYLVMTATPIPRSVTMTLLGDLDVSIMDQSPPGRQKVHTYHVQEDQRDKWWEFFCEKLSEGRQGYYVAPLVEESESIEATSLDELYEVLANGPLEAFRIGLLHGRMSNEEKDQVMADFRSGEIQVLVCTTVIEVGVDVPNATLMTIENAERFGLAQLHQLRGRISRGRYPGYCAVFSDAEAEERAERLKAFTNSTNGFELAEIDFKLRGPGEIFGTKQHGMPPLRIADLSRDTEILLEARHDARDLIEQDPGLSREEHALLRRQMLARYGKVLQLGDVG